MKNIINLLTAIALFCLCLQFPAQAQNRKLEIETNQQDRQTTPERIEPEIEINQQDRQTIPDEPEEEEKEEKKPTRSYTALGGTIGVSGESTPLGEGGFAILGRSAFSNNLSLHTASIFGDVSLTTLAFTFGIPIKSGFSEREIFFPFVGAGIAIEDLFGDNNVDALITTGVDIPIYKRIVATARLDVSFPEDDTNLGFSLGLGYNFTPLDIFSLF